MRRTTAHILAISTLAALTATACAPDATAPRRLAPERASLTIGPPWGPETPHFNLEAVLRPVDDNGGFGLVKFRQPNDADKIIYLDVWVRDLAPNTNYRLQRATDGVVNDDCTGTNWLSLGWGATPRLITTDDRGTGRASLFRQIASPLGSTFDIHFRVIEAVSSTVVLESACYQFTVSQ